MKTKILLLILLLLPVISLPQTLKLNNAGINGGVSLNFGSTLQRIGLYIGSFYYYDFIQFNFSSRLYCNFKTYGPSIRGFEFQPTLGIVTSFGEVNENADEFYFSLGNQTHRKYALGYAFNFYFDQMETSQRTGTILIGIDRFEFITENDILGTKRSDRFRTGAIKFSYRVNNMLFSISTIMWTGNPQSPKTIRGKESDFPSRFGYIDFSQAPYGRYSNGILALQYKRAINYGQDLQVSAGVDSERVRNFFQNKVIHDMYFWPVKWNKARNPHLPMLDSEGEPFTYKKGQKIKATSFFWDLSLNPSTFY